MSKVLKFPVKIEQENVGIPRGALEQLQIMATRMREELLDLADSALIISNAARITLEQNRPAI